MRRRRAAIDVHQKQVKPVRRSSCWMNFTHMHFVTRMCGRRCGARAACPATTMRDAMIEHDGDVGKLLKLLDELKIADNTIVDLHDRQRPEPVLLAGRGDYAVPQRKGLQLGRRLPRAGDGPLAGPYQGRRDYERNVLRPGLVSHADGRRRRSDD